MFVLLLPVSAAGSPTLTMSGANAEPGQDVELTLSISNNTGIAGLALSLDYDKTALSVKSCTDGKLFSSLTVGKNYIFDDSVNIKSNGTLAKYVFTVNKNAADGDYEIKVIVRSCTNAELVDVKCVTVNGTIKVCGHKNSVLIPGKPATCTANGLSDGKKCANCGKILVAQTQLKALGHNIVKDAAVAATCTAAGKTSGEHCTRCTYAIKQNTINALGHNYTEKVISPTSKEKGYTLFTCTRCGDSYKSNYTDVVKEYLMCDVNFDGKVSAADARLILRNAVGLEEFTALQKKVALTGNSDIISSADARIALRTSVGLEPMKYIK